jgi:hypothetical protein
MTFKHPSYIFYLSSQPSNAVFFTNAYFQYGLSYNLPGKSNKLTKLGLNLSIAFLKKAWVDSGWLVTFTGLVIVAKVLLGATFDYVVEVEDFKLVLLNAAF